MQYFFNLNNKHDPLFQRFPFDRLAICYLKLSVSSNPFAFMYSFVSEYFCRLPNMLQGASSSCVHEIYLVPQERKKENIYAGIKNNLIYVSFKVNMCHQLDHLYW